MGPTDRTHRPVPWFLTTVIVRLIGKALRSFKDLQGIAGGTASSKPTSVGQPLVSATPGKCLRSVTDANGKQECLPHGRILVECGCPKSGHSGTPDGARQHLTECS